MILEFQNSATNKIPLKQVSKTNEKTEGVYKKKMQK